MNCIISDLRADSGKVQCGDYIKTTVVGDFVLLVLSDGVGSRHHDYIASKTACESFFENFVNAEAMQLKERFVFALKQADQDVSFPENPSHTGMMATLVAIVINTLTGEIIWDSIGDSRFYGFVNNKLKQISQDSIKAVIMRGRDGKIIKKDGVFVIRNGLTNALGYNGAIINPKFMSLNNGDSLILCSDGMYELAGFENQIGEFLKAEVSHELLSSFIEKNSTKFEDDASIIIFQESTINDELQIKLNEIIESKTDSRDKDIAEHIMSGYIRNQLGNCLSAGNTEISHLSSYIVDFKLCLPEQSIMSFMSDIKNLKNTRCFT